MRTVMPDKAPSQDSLLIRADASPTIGTGHVMRCLALAQAWQSAGGRAGFASREMPDRLAARLRAEGCAIFPIDAGGQAEDARMTAAAAHAVGASWVVTDGYAFDDAMHGRLKASGLRVAAIDDRAQLDRCQVDLLINQNLDADRTHLERCAPGVRLLLGTRFALLRREFWPWRDWRRPVAARVKRVLVMAGGSDPHRLAELLIQALSRLGGPGAEEPAGIEAKVVVGPANSRLSAVQREAAAAALPVEVVHDAHDMAALMSWCDFALSSGGSTAWELAMLGTPMALVATVDVEVRPAQALGAAGGCVYLGPRDELSALRVAEAVAQVLSDPARRRSLSTAAARLVDGYGGDRVAAALKDEMTDGAVPGHRGDVPA